MPRALALALLAAALLYAQGVAYGLAVYDGKGVPVKVTVEVGRGNGTVEIRGLTYYDATFWASTVSACWEAAIAAGLDPFAYNYTVVVEPVNASRALVGTSLSLAVAVAAYGALTKTPINASIAFTGTVAPGGVVDFVGGLVEKAAGARQYGFKLFVYPVLQHYDYKIVMRPRLYGVYGSLVETFQITPLPLAQITAVAEVGNIYQAVALATGSSYNFTANLARLDAEARAVLNGAESPTAGALLGEIYLYVNKSLLLADKRPDYADTLRQGVARALAYVQTAKNYTAAASEALPRALLEVLVPYFYVRIATSPDEAAQEADAYLDALLQTVSKLANKSAEPCDDALGHMYAHLAAVLKQQGDRNLAYFYLFGDLEYAAEAAYYYGQAAYSLWKAALYLSPPRAEDYDANKTLALFKKYVRHALYYADLYSRATDVISPQLLGQGASLNYLRGTTAEGQGDYKAALGYYTEALTYVITYFALHPAFPNTTAVKYLQYLDALSHVLDDNSTTIRENLALASLAEVNETRVLYLARAHACQLLRKWAAAAPANSTNGREVLLPRKPSQQEKNPWPQVLIPAVLFAAVYTAWTLAKRRLEKFHYVREAYVKLRYLWASITYRSKRSRRRRTTALWRTRSIAAPGEYKKYTKYTKCTKNIKNVLY